MAKCKCGLPLTGLEELPFIGFLAILSHVCAPRLEGDEEMLFVIVEQSITKPTALKPVFKAGTFDQCQHWLVEKGAKQIATIPGNPAAYTPSNDDPRTWYILDLIGVAEPQ